MKSLAALAAVCTLALAGCGGGKSKAGPPIRLSVDAPPDLALVTDAQVEVSGRVGPPGATVLVEGQATAVRGGRFTATVPLEPGTNVVDVLAGRHGSSPAMVALRVRRQVDVTVPELAGATPGDAQDELAGLGLTADVKKAGGVIELLLPEDARVCDTDPPAGSRVAPDTTVVVHVAKLC